METTATRQHLTRISPTSGEARQYVTVTVERDGVEILRRSRKDAATATIAIVRLEDNASWLRNDPDGRFATAALAQPEKFAIVEIEEA